MEADRKTRGPNERSILMRRPRTESSFEAAINMPHSTSPRTATIDGHEIDVASLETIDYGRLSAKEPAEVEKLLHACQMPGFFYLDFQNGPAKELIADVPEIYAVSKQYFDQPQEVKMKDYRAEQDRSQDRGFKSYGEAGGFEISREEMIQGKLVLPHPLAQHTDLFKRFSSLCHSAGLTLLSNLSDALSLNGADRFETRHQDHKPNDTGLKLLYDPTKALLADSPDNTHTDGGTVTLVFGTDWGIKLEHPHTKHWAFIEPRPQCALVNVADSLQAISGKRLHSCRHRVTQAVDGYQKRYFAAYFMRPDKVA